MKWLALVLSLIRLLLALVEYLERRQKIKEAEAAVLRELLSDADARLAKVRAASDAATSERVPDDSPVFRD